jgi:hypothetical protein
MQIKNHDYSGCAASFRGPRPETVPGLVWDREGSVGGFFRPDGVAPVRIIVPGASLGEAKARAKRSRAKRLRREASHG